MSRTWAAASLALAVCLLLVSVVALFADTFPPPNPTEIAKLPDPPAAPAPAAPAAAVEAGAAVTSQSFRIDLLPDLPESSVSSELLLARARNSWAARETADAKALFAQAAQAADTAAGGWAGIQLALYLRWEGRHEEADALTSRVARAAPEAGLRELAIAVSEAQALAQRGDLQATADRYGAFARQWAGTQSAAWAAIQQADLYRDQLHDSETAREIYAQVAQDYAGPPRRRPTAR